MGHDALYRVLRAELEIDPATALRAAVLAHFDRDDIATALRDMFGHDRPALSERDYARLAPAVLECARAGDAAAVRIVDEHARKLSEYALAAARKVGLRPPDSTLVLNGGLFRDKSRTLVSALQRHLPREDGFATTRLGEEPALGALLMAFDNGSIEVTANTQSRLVSEVRSALERVTP